MGCILKRVSHDEFKDTLKPAMLKAMLRNPEVVLETNGLILSGLGIDLSQYVAEVRGVSALLTNFDLSNVF